MLLDILIYLHRFLCHNTSSTSYKYSPIFLIPTTPFKICHLHIRMLSSSHSKCHPHMRPRNLHIAPTQNMSSTYNAKETIYLAPTQFHVNMSSRYFGQFQNPLIIYQIEISSCETPASICLQNLPVVPITTLFLNIF